MFYGIIIRMFYDNKEHHMPHIHLEYGEYTAVIELPTGKILAGDFLSNKLKLVLARMEIHNDELMANWSWPWKEILYLK